MKTIQKEETKKVTATIYVAIDGTEFRSEEDCEKYEKSAECAIHKRLDAITVIRQGNYSQESMFLCGSDDCDVEVVVPRNPEDINAINQLVALTQGRSADSISGLISDAHIGQHIVICYAYDHDWAWLVTEETIKSHWEKVFNA